MIKGDAHSACIQNPRLPLIVHNGAGAEVVAAALHIKFLQQRLAAFQQEIVVPGQNRLKFTAGDFRALLVDVCTVLFLPFQLNGAVGIVIDADAVLFPFQHAGLLLLVGGVPVVVKIQAADEVTAVHRVGVWVQQRGNAGGDQLLFAPANQVFPFVAVDFPAHSLSPSITWKGMMEPSSST